MQALVHVGLKDFTNWPTIPRLYVKGPFVGGCDTVRELFRAGELQELLTEKGVENTGGLRAGQRTCFCHGRARARP